jgi:type III restriction enzyme
VTAYQPKTYQNSVLESVETYFRACYDLPNPRLAFYDVTERLWGAGLAYHPIAGFPDDMPYFCLRVPTGGGKTWLAAKSVAVVNTHLLRSEHSLILWLTPSKPIRDQTIKALRERSHPYHAALREAGPVTVIDLAEAKAVSRATLDTSTVVIVATVQAFRREDTEFLKVYESNGALMHHFDNLSSAQRAELLTAGAGIDQTIPCSLANVLRLRRPFVIVDEAHNSRTELSFDTLARFRPSGIMELTATPDTVRTPSNVLHSVSAAELKGEEMIKLPIVLETEPNWQQCLADAIARRGELHALAEAEGRRGAAYLRPIILIQAEKRRQGVDTLDVDRVRKELLDNHRVPAEEIVVATGEETGPGEDRRRLTRRGVADPACAGAQCIITQTGARRGLGLPVSPTFWSAWPSLHSATAVEQLLGRVLRQPEAPAIASSRRAQPVLCLRRVARLCRDGETRLRERLVHGRRLRAARSVGLRHGEQAGSGPARPRRPPGSHRDSPGCRTAAGKAGHEGGAQSDSGKADVGRQGKDPDHFQTADRR